MGLTDLSLSKTGLVSLVRQNPVTSSLVAGAVGTGAIVGTIAGVSALRKKSKKRKKTRTKSTRKRCRRTHNRKKRKGRRTPRTAGKGKDRSTKRIRYTKNRQPYIILKSGKARFIKKSSARRSHKRKGGRY